MTVWNGILMRHCSVPLPQYVVVDNDGDGFASITVDGSKYTEPMNSVLEPLSNAFFLCLIGNFQARVIHMPQERF